MAFLNQLLCKHRADPVHRRKEPQGCVDRVRRDLLLLLQRTRPKDFVDFFEHRLPNALLTLEFGGAGDGAPETLYRVDGRSVRLVLVHDALRPVHLCDFGQAVDDSVVGHSRRATHRNQHQVQRDGAFTNATSTENAADR